MLCIIYKINFKENFNLFIRLFVFVVFMNVVTMNFLNILMDKIDKLFLLD